MQLLSAKSAVLRNSKHITPEALLQLTSDTRQLLSRECKTMSGQEFHAVMASGSLISSANQVHGTSWSALWLPIDLFLEDAMDGSEVAATSTIEILTGRSQFLYISASVFDLPGVDETFFLLAVLLNQIYCCRFSKGSAGC